MSKTKAPTAIEILDLLGKAGEQDLEGISEQIVALESELAETIASYQKKIEALRLIERVIGIRLHGKPPRKSRKRAAGDQVDEGESGRARPVEETPKGKPLLADEIARVLDSFGPLTVRQLAQKLAGQSEQAIRIAIGRARGRFRMNDDERFSLAE